jgi:predicted phage-related endonuclease
LAGEACEKNKKTALICAYANALRTVNTDEWKQEEQENKMKNELIRYRAMLMIIGEYDSNWKPSTSKEQEIMKIAKLRLAEEGIIQ